MASSTLIIEDLHAGVEGKEILKGVDLEVPRGEVHALMGPNGSGKSTLASVIMGHPAFTVTRGRILWRGTDLVGLGPDERARLGIFLAFQYPVEVPGVPLLPFLRTALSAVRGEEVPVKAFRKELKDKLELLQMDAALTQRHLNAGLSGGEKKRNEVLQLALLAPQLAVLDETDSGLDIDALRIVSDAVAHMRGPDVGFLVITHYLRMLEPLHPDRVHVLLDGRVVRSGDASLAQEIEAVGYDALRLQYGGTPVPEDAVA